MHQQKKNIFILNFCGSSIPQIFTNIPLKFFPLEAFISILISVGPDPDITDIGVDPSTSPGVDPTLPRVETSFSLVQQPTHDDIAMDPDHPEYVDTADYRHADI